MKIRKKLLAAAIALPAALMGTAQAAIVIDFTLDLSGVDGVAAGTSFTMDEITFTGIAHAVTNVGGGDGTVDPGDRGYTDGLLSATSFSLGGSTIFGTGLNSAYEMTFDFTVDTVNLGGGLTTHIAPGAPLAQTDGLLDIYVDGPTGGVGVASQTAGTGYTDGVKVATFRVINGGGGIFTPLTFDGSDDATFELVSSLAGVLLDSVSGLDLDPGTTLALTDSNFDGDPGDPDPDGFDVPATTTNAGGVGFGTWGSGGGTQVDFYAIEDGSTQLAAVPAPATIALAGLGFLGMGAVGRRRKGKKLES